MSATRPARGAAVAPTARDGRSHLANECVSPSLARSESDRHAAGNNVRISGFQRLFFLVVEPICALVGLIWAAFLPDEYMRMLGSRATLDPPTRSVLLSLANLVRQDRPEPRLSRQYGLFAFNEAFILRASRSRRVWRTLLLGAAA